MSGILQAAGLSKRFRNADALNGLDLDVPEGSVYGFIGPNGAGKTTTIKILMNIHKPTSGRSGILGVDSRRLGPDDFAKIGYVSENQEMPEWMTVDYLLSYLKPFYPTWDDARAAELVRQFELPGGRKLRHLSRGMRMKTALVAALAYHPRVLVMDEPFSGLDPMVREDLVESLLESADETTIFISSHDLADIESFASHIGYIENGRLKFSEEMGALAERFRQVEVLVGGMAALPDRKNWPANWLRPETTPSVVRFVESRFDAEGTNREIHKVFGNVQQVSVTPMPLRAIFIALARTASRPATS